jgi:hypothetical protein
LLEALSPSSAVFWPVDLDGAADGLVFLLAAVDGTALLPRAVDETVFLPAAVDKTVDEAADGTACWTFGCVAFKPLAVGLVLLPKGAAALGVSFGWDAVAAEPLVTGAPL